MADIPQNSEDNLPEPESQAEQDEEFRRHFDKSKASEPTSSLESQEDWAKKTGANLNEINQNSTSFVKKDPIKKELESNPPELTGTATYSPTGEAVGQN